MEKLEEMLDSLDPPYPTIEELKIGRMLDRYGIPFFYRQPTVVMDPETKQNEIWKPSFTLPQYGCSVIDYIADARAQDKIIQTYRYNQIPAAVLGPKDLDKPNWQQELYHKIQRQLKVSEYSLVQLLKS